MEELMCHERGKNMQKPYSQVRLSKRSTRAFLIGYNGAMGRIVVNERNGMNSRVIDHTKQFWLQAHYTILNLKRLG